MKILVTGFESFGGEKINPSIEAVKRLPDNIGGAEIIKMEIPTVRWKTLKKIDQAVEKYNPDVIISVGQAGGRSDINVERVGINVDDFRIEDNEGNQPCDEPIDAAGPDGYFLNVPVKAMVDNIRKHQIPASVSDTAGTYVCNHVAYGTRRMIETKYPGKRSGFIHIPYLPQQVMDKKGVPSMSLQVVVEGLAAALEAIAEEINK